MYIEVTVEEAIEMLKKSKSKKVFVSVYNLETQTAGKSIQQSKDDYLSIFNNVQTIASLCDDMVKQLNCFSEKQDIKNIQPKGVQKIVLFAP